MGTECPGGMWGWLFGHKFCGIFDSEPSKYCLRCGFIPGSSDADQ